jgi:hypothetical protein
VGAAVVQQGTRLSQLWLLWQQQLVLLAVMLMVGEQGWT